MGVETVSAEAWDAAWLWAETAEPHPSLVLHESVNVASRLRWL